MEKMERELFEMVYQWGRVGVITDEHCPSFRDKIKEISINSNMRIVKRILKEIPKEMKQLDKNDPDNYGACYAIGGFNDCLRKVVTVISSLERE